MKIKTKYIHKGKYKQNMAKSEVERGESPQRSLANWGAVCGNISGFVVNISTWTLG